MKRIVLQLVCLVILLLPTSVCAATINTSGCTDSAVQTGINSASTGDTVVINGGSACSATWSSGVSITGKTITLQGGGVGVTQITANSSAAVTCGTPSRITGLDITINGYYGILYNGNVATTSMGNLRADHCKFTYNGSSIRRGVQLQGVRPNYYAWGVIDHNTFNNCSVLTYWDLSCDDSIDMTFDTLGQPTNVTYIEDNTFNMSMINTIDQNCGGSYVFRYNTVNLSGSAAYIFETHSAQGDGCRGTRRWEIYRNTFNIAASPWCLGMIRGGTGVIFGNTGTGLSSDTGWALDNVRSFADPTLYCDGTDARDGNTQPTSTYHGYPCRDQIGRGVDSQLGSSGNLYPQALQPAYFWNTIVGGIEQTASVSNQGYCPIHIVENRDFYNYNASFNGTAGIGVGTLANRPSTCTPYVGYWATDQGSWNRSASGGQGVLYKCTATNTWTLYYTPYTYPHPLQNAGPPDTQPPTVPTNLTATAISSNQINLSWTASTDNVGVTGYQIYRCQGTGCTPSTQIGTSTTNSYSDTGLSPSTTYVYRVAAYDAAGNVSGQSSSTTATTQAGSTTGILGYDTIGSIADTGYSNYINASRFTMPNQSGTVTLISVYIASPISASPNNQYQVAIYSDANNLPGALITSSQSRTITGNSWNTIPISATLSANTSYWLAYNTNGLTASNNNVRTDSGSTGQLQWRAQTFGSWPATFGTLAGSAAYKMSIYATYTVGGANTPPGAPAGVRIE
jgi:hypothetical protein